MLENVALRVGTQEVPLRGLVTVIKDVPPGEMSRLYLNHNVCVLPAVNEPLGISPLEAMAHGCVPLVSTGTGAAGTIASAGDGMVFAQDDVNDLTEKLRRFAQDKQLLHKKSVKVREFANSKLSPAVFAEKLVQLIEQEK